MKAREFITEYRRDITATKYKDKLVARGESESPEDILTSLEKADPTSNKQYMIWIVTRYLAGDFLLEDVSIVNQYLTKFIESRARIEQKDLGRYTLKSLKELINGLYKSTGSSDAKETGLYPVLPETKVLYNGPLGQFVIPLTLKASQALQRIGHEAEWCTADSRAPTYFQRYSAQGPLYIWIAASGEKYQFHFESNQFMNEYDIPITNDQMQELFRKYSVLQDLLSKKFIEYNNLEYISDKLKTPEICLAAVKQDGWQLQFVPDKLKTPEICLAAVKENGRALHFVPTELITPEICLAAVEQNGMALISVPDKLKSEVYLAAVKQDRRA